MGLVNLALGPSTNPREDFKGPQVGFEPCILITATVFRPYHPVPLPGPAVLSRPSPHFLCYCSVLLFCLLFLTDLEDAGNPATCLQVLWDLGSVRPLTLLPKVHLTHVRIFCVVLRLRLQLSLATPGLLQEA